MGYHQHDVEKVHNPPDNGQLLGVCPKMAEELVYIHDFHPVTETLFPGGRPATQHFHGLARDLTSIGVGPVPTTLVVTATSAVTEPSCPRRKGGFNSFRWPLPPEHERQRGVRGQLRQPFAPDCHRTHTAPGSVTFMQRAKTPGESTPRIDNPKDPQSDSHATMLKYILRTGPTRFQSIDHNRPLDH